jgi:hypothetical protein
VVKVTDEDLKEIEEFYKCGLLAWHDKGEASVTDIPKLIKYIRELENEIDGYDNDGLFTGNCR